MAFTVTARQSAPNAGTSTANLVTASTTPSANSLYLVCVGAQMDAFGTETLPVFATPTGGSLTYTKIDSHGDVTPGFLWGSTNGFWTGGAVYSAPVGGSPSAFAVTVDGAGGATVAYHSAVCLDITGHNTTTPIVQHNRNGARINPESSSTAGTVTLSSTPTAGNLIVVAFMCGTDTAGAVSSPTAGAGKTFTTVTAQSPAFCTTGVFYRVADGSESTTITTSDLGQLVGNYVAIAFEIAAPSSGNATATPAVVAGVAAVPSVTVKTGAGAAPAAVAGVGTVPAPTVTTGSNATATPSVVSALAGVPAAVIKTGTAVLAAAVVAVAGIAAPSVTSGSNASASATTVAAVATVPTATIKTGSKASPATVAGAASVPAPTLTYRYVTSVSGRYFVDQNGSPILVRGESPWAMFTKLSSSEMDTYLANRQGYGCNLALVSMVGAVANGGPADTGATYDGVLPFTGGDPTAFNSTYWSRMDSYIAKARDRGITLMIYPMDGWNTAFASVVFNPGSISNAQCQTYGQTLATRYLSYPNIIWAFGGDYNEDATINARFNACLTGIRAAGDTRPASIQLLYETSESHNSSFWEPKVNYDWVYTYYVTYKGVSDAYNWTWSGSPTARPGLFGEGAYENSSAPHNGTDTALRRQACWALTSGSPGEITGQEDVWDFQSGWAGLLNTTAASQIKAIRDTFEPLKWWTLVPDDANQLVTAGRGTRITTDSATFPSSNNYVTAARAADASLAVIYLPNASSAITVDMTKIGANPVATWVDPCTGATSSATVGSSYSKGNNSAGATDWLLILTGDSGTTITPASVSCVAAVPASVVKTGATASPAVVTAVVTVPAVTVAAGVSTAPTTVAGTAGIASVTVTAGTKATPGTVATTAAVPAPSVAAGGSASASASTVIAVGDVPAVSVHAAATVPVATVTGAASIPSPVVAVGAKASPGTVTAVAAISVPAVLLGVTPATVAAAAGVPVPSLSTTVRVPVATVIGVAAIPTPAVATFVPVTVRPNSGRTIRPSTGTTTRP